MPSPLLTAAPSPAGTAESLTVSDLQPQTRYYFALRATDENGQTSVLSNVVEVTTGTENDEEAPADVLDLHAFTELIQGGAVDVLQAVSSGDYPGDWDVSNLIDGLDHSAWASQAFTNQMTSAEIIFELDVTAPVTVAGVRMSPYPGFRDLFPRSFRLETSEDGDEYTPVADRTAFQPPDGPAEILFEPESARYVKLRSRRSPTSSTTVTPSLPVSRCLNPRAMVLRWWSSSRHRATTHIWDEPPVTTFGTTRGPSTKPTLAPATF